MAVTREKRHSTVKRISIQQTADRHIRAARAAVMCATITLGLPVAMAGGPPGDVCSDCIAIGEGITTGSTAGYSASGHTSSCANSTDTVDAWFCYTPSCTGVVTIDTCGAGTNFDTVLSVYTSCGLEFALDCNDDFCGLHSQITWNASGGTTYFIRLAGYNGATGNYELNVVCGNPGDECSDCIPIAEGVVAGTTSGNTGALDDTSCAVNDIIDEWYCYTPTCTGIATASTCGVGTGFDTTLAVFTACDQEFELACNDDACDLQSEVSWPVAAGTSYFIRVSGFNEAAGDFELTVSCQFGGGIVDFYLDESEWQTLMEQTTKFEPVAGATFEEAMISVTPGFNIMDDPLHSTTDNGVFAPADIDLGLAFASNLEEQGTGGPNPRGTSGLLAIHPNNTYPAVIPDIIVASQIIADSFDIIATLPVPIPNPAANPIPIPYPAMAMRVHSLAGSPSLLVSCYDENDVLVGQISVPNGSFVAATPINVPFAGEVGIARVNVWDPAGGAEGISEVILYGNPCAGDVPGVSPGVVDVEDLLEVLGAWGPCPAPCPPSCAEDMNADCFVNVQDLLIVLGAWGACN